MILPEMLKLVRTRQRVLTVAGEPLQSLVRVSEAARAALLAAG